MKYKLLIDFRYPDRTAEIRIKKNDADSRVLEFKLADGGKMVDVGEVSVAAIRAVKPDGTLFFDDADADPERDLVTYAIPRELTQQAGRISLELALTRRDESEISSFEIYLIVENILFDENQLIGQNDLGGFKAFLTRAQLAAERAEGVRDTFIMGTMSAEALIAKLNNEYEMYVEYLQDIQKKVEEGYFNGPRGAQGENGADAVVVEGSGIIGFCMHGDHLVCHYSGDEPNFEIDSNGHLICYLD